MLRYLTFPIYRHGDAGLSNLLMSLEIGVGLAALLDRALVLRGNGTPVGNVVAYDNPLVSRWPAKVTDFFDLPVPWAEIEDVALNGLPVATLGGQPVWDCAFCYPAEQLEHPALPAFLGPRSKTMTVDAAQMETPVLAFDAGEDAGTLCFYSYFFFLDPPHRRLVWSALKRLRPKAPFAELVKRGGRRHRLVQCRAHPPRRFQSHLRHHHPRAPPC